MFLKDIEKLTENRKLVDYIRHIENVLIDSYRSPNSAIQLRDFVVSKKEQEFLELYLEEYGWKIVFNDRKNNDIPYIKRL